MIWFMIPPLFLRVSASPCLSLLAPRSPLLLPAPRFPLPSVYPEVPGDATVPLSCTDKDKPKPAAGKAAEQFRKLRRDAKRRAIGA